MKRILSLLMVGFLILGCGQGSKGPEQTEIKVTFWGTPEEIHLVENALSGWEAEHPDIKIVYQHTPYTGYDSKILTRIAGGAAPDIITTEADYFVTFASKNVLEDLSPYIQSDTKGFSTADFFPGIIERFTHDGKLLALPRDVAPFACVFYNKDIFDEARIPYPADDWTLDDLMGIAKKLTVKDDQGRTTRYGFYTWAWKNFVYSFGGGLVDDVDNPTKTLLDSEESIAGLQYYADLIHEHGIMPSGTALANFGMGLHALFVKGQVAMFGSGIWDTPGLRNYDFNWDVVMFPRKKGSTAPAFGTGGTGYAILKSSKNKEAAWEVLKALTGAKTQQQFAKGGLAQPSRISVANSDVWAKDDQKPLNKKMLNEAVNYAVYGPFHPKWREAEEKILNPKLDVIFSGKQTAKEVVTQLAPEINRLLKSN